MPRGHWCVPSALNEACWSPRRMHVNASSWTRLSCALKQRWFWGGWCTDGPMGGEDVNVKAATKQGGKVGRTFVFVSWDRWVVLCGRERGGDKLLPTKQRCVDTQILIIPKSQVYHWSNIFEIRLYFVLLGWCGCDLLIIANESRVGVANRIELVAES